ncbi:transcription termination/antitermination protein NusG [Pectinatus cerevisiiphilus]|uniref:Transcription termination/antitermination protein NusG n=1 Tax=Pectinatus cerevisiiphilus TaxID=86956 RepID=A0A4R3K1U6_9FIRM|nr:transcription termination/antitermination protein NusG [Pectinatus cerevisiiphilus]TCS75945.1 transcription antitermination protein nusG [Pectinatus cerevisiiphilus]
MSINAETEKRWYVIHTYSGYENKVKVNLERKVHSMGMESEIFKIVVPLENEIEKKNGKEKVVSHKVFPGYVLVEMIVSDRSWYVVRNTPGVTGFVGSGTKPIPLTEGEVKKILSACGEDAAAPTAAKANIDVEVGESVHINSGAFENFAATVSEIDYNKAKVKLIVDMFGRETTVEVGFDQIEKI